MPRITASYLKRKYPGITIIPNRGRYNYIYLPPGEKEPIRGHYVFLRTINWQIPYDIDFRKMLKRGEINPRKVSLSPFLLTTKRRVKPPPMPIYLKESDKEKAISLLARLGYTWEFRRADYPRRGTEIEVFPPEGYNFGGELSSLLCHSWEDASKRASQYKLKKGEPNSLFKQVVVPHPGWVCSGCATFLKAGEVVAKRGKEILCTKCVRKGRNPRTYHTVGFYQSKSDPSKTYLVKVDEKGSLSCSCPQWLYRLVGGVRTCRHVRDIESKHNPLWPLENDVEEDEGLDFGNPSLYQAFHGNPPVRERKVDLPVPKKGAKLLKIGRLIAVEYEPEFPSKLKGIHYRHESGDTGRTILKNKPILATDEKGKALYIIPTSKKYPRMTGKGIVG